MINSLLLLRRLRKHLKLNRSQLELIQLKKLKALLHHAYENVPYYKALFDSVGIKPGEIKDVGDLHKIPTTGKIKLQSLNLEEILVGGISVDRCVVDVTSGSTGIPLKVYFTKEDYLIRSLIFIRTFMESGYKLTDRQAIVCDTRFVSEKEHWFQHLGIFRKNYIPVQMDLEKQIKMIVNYKPNYIHGYPLSLVEIAQGMLDRGINSISPRMVCTGAELVTHRTRETINLAFDVDMVDTYATIESGLIAWECWAHKGYHVNLDNVVLELLCNGRPALPGEKGRAVITNLHSYAMPIIRYELGDVCIFSKDICSCGSDLPLMSIIEGRIDDMIYAASGKVVSPNSITNAMEAVEGISQFRVVQETENALTVLLVKGKEFSRDTPKSAECLIKQLVGEEMDVNVKIVSDIPKAHSGKIRAVISKIPRKSGPLGHP
jgi:phenylacetate-CoA ligase